MHNSSKRSRAWLAVSHVGRYVVALSLIATATLTSLLLSDKAALATSSFKAPWTCGVSWHASTYTGHAGNGVDFNNLANGSDNNAPVLASGAGTVTLVPWNSDSYNYGNMVKINHGGGWETRYAHLASFATMTDRNPLLAGTQVNQGDLLGNVGSTEADSPHLHYEQRLNNIGQNVAFDGAAIAVGTTYTASDPTHTSTNCGSATYHGDTLGVYDPSNGAFYLRNSNTAGPHDISLSFGNSGWVPLAGDWDNNGTFTPGVYNPSNSWFYLRNSNTSGPADTSFQYGNAGWVPLVGDWNGNGYWSIGVFDPVTATFHLRDSNSTGPADYIFQYGCGGWKPIAGDWDNNGTSTVGIYDPAGAVFHLNNGNDGSPAEYSFQYGNNSGWLPLAGDWDGNGYSSIGAYDPATATFHLRNLNSSGPADVVAQYGNNTGWKPVVGDWDGQ